jgi:TonB family protein
MSDGDDWREERLRARRQREAEEAVAEAERAARAAPPPAEPERRLPPRAPFPTSGLPPFSFKAPTFARRRAPGSAATQPFALNALQMSLIALGLVLLISIVAAKLRSHPSDLAASASPSVQRSALQTAADEAWPTAYSAPSAPAAPEPVAAGGDPVSANPQVPSGSDTAAQVIERPSEEQFAAAFPDQAGPSDYQGRAVIRCAISASAEPGGCSVVSETPAGAGFGEAALSLIHKFKFRPKMVSGEAVDGGVVTVPVQFAR